MLDAMADIYIELQRNGAYLKCTAIDAATGEEAMCFGPPREAEALKRIAVQKLRNKQGQRPHEPRGDGDQGSGGGTDIKV